MILKKKEMLQANMRKKKIPAQDHRPKKIHARTVGWKKNSGDMFPVLTREFLYQQLVKRF